MPRPRVHPPAPIACYACRGAGCLQCQGSGLACPECHGKRVRWGRACPICCEGNNVNPIREARAIQAQLVRLRAIQRATVRRSA